MSPGRLTRPVLATLVGLIIAVALMVVFILINSSDVEPGGVTSEPLNYDQEQTGTLLAPVGPEKTGITFRNELAPSNQISTPITEPGWRPVTMAATVWWMFTW